MEALWPHRARPIQDHNNASVQSNGGGAGTDVDAFHPKQPPEPGGDGILPVAGAARDDPHSVRGNGIGSELSALELPDPEPNIGVRIELSTAGSRIVALRVRLGLSDGAVGEPEG